MTDTNGPFTREELKLRVEELAIRRLELEHASRALDHSIAQLSYRLQALQQGHQEYEQGQSRMLIGLAKDARIAHEHGYMMTVHATNESGLPTAIEVTHEESGHKWHWATADPMRRSKRQTCFDFCSTECEHAFSRRHR